MRIANPSNSENILELPGSRTTTELNFNILKSSYMKYFIYEIKNTETDKVYIGRTNNPSRRYAGHKSKLNTGTHPSKDLQKDYDEQGSDKFTFQVIEELETLEQAHVREEINVQFQKEHHSSYNVMGGGRKGLPRDIHPLTGTTMSEETRQKVSNSKKGKTIGSDNHFYGKHHTEETKELISQSRKGKAVGGDNPYSKKVSVNGVVYGSVREARESVGMTRHSFSKYLLDPGNDDFKYVK